MTIRRRILVLHAAGGPPADLRAIALALTSEDAEVRLVDLGLSYERALDAIEDFDIVLVWR